MKEFDQAAGEAQAQTQAMAPLFKVTKHTIKKEKQPGKSSSSAKKNNLVGDGITHQNGTTAHMELI